MDLFYIIVLVIAFMILIIILVLVGMTINTASTKGKSFPPVMNNCPDYWEYSNDFSGCVVPNSNQTNIGTIYDKTGILSINQGNSPGLKNVGNAGNMLSTSGWVIDFNDAEWRKGGVSPVCNQKIWANTNSLMFDGISNYNGC
jgi:hypothetical protein